MVSERIAETVAMLAIGDGVLCAAKPERHTKLWLGGPSWWRAAWRPVVKHPNVTRLLGLAGVGFGFWLASREWSRAAEERAMIGGGGCCYGSGQTAMR